jgi:hypothetical protein
MIFSMITTHFQDIFRLDMGWRRHGGQLTLWVLKMTLVKIVDTERILGSRLERRRGEKWQTAQRQAGNTVQQCKNGPFLDDAATRQSARKKVRAAAASLWENHEKNRSNCVPTLG